MTHGTYPQSQTESFKSEWARRNAAKAAANRTKTDVDEKTRKRLDQVKAAMKRYRAALASAEGKE